MYSSLNDHDLINSTFKTKISQLVTPLDKDSDWSHSKCAEYSWIALILFSGKRTDMLEKAMTFTSSLMINTPIDGINTLPTMSQLIGLSEENKNKFIKTLIKFFNISVLSPLTLVLPENEIFLNKKFFNPNENIKTNLATLKNLLVQLSDQHSQLSVDIRYLIIYSKLIQNKIVFRESQEHLFNSLNRFPFLDIEDPEIKLINSQICSMELAFSSMENTKYSYSKSFWNNISKLTDCEVYALEMDKSNLENFDQIKNNLYHSLNYYNDLLQSIDHNNEKLFVLASLLTYSYKQLLEVINHELRFTIAGRLIVRTCIENFIMSKFLVSEETNHSNIWEEFQYYGIGKYKLIALRYKENKPNLTNSHLNFNYLDFLISEYINPELIDMDLKYFDKKNIRQKADLVNEGDLYRYQYDYDSQFEHALWGAIRESSVLKCNAHTHQLHGVPDIDYNQELPDIGPDLITILEKHLKLIQGIFPVPKTKGQQND